MSNEVESAQVSDAMVVPQLSSLAAVDSHAGSCEAEMPSRLLNDAVRSLPYYVVKDLLSIGVRSLCIFYRQITLSKPFLLLHLVN